MMNVANSFSLRLHTFPLFPSTNYHEILKNVDIRQAIDNESVFMNQKPNYSKEEKRNLEYVLYFATLLREF